jgi:hypothetical protein
MVFTRKSLQKFFKRAVKVVRKGMNTGEKIVNAIDRSTGGGLRDLARTATGGLSEQALKVYNANKGYVKKGLDLAEGKKGATVANLVEGSKLQKPFEQGAKQLQKYEPVIRKAGQQNESLGKVMKLFSILNYGFFTRRATI